MALHASVNVLNGVTTRTAPARDTYRQSTYAQKYVWMYLME